MCKFAQVISCCGETYYVLGERLKDGPFLPARRILTADGIIVTVNGLNIWKFRAFGRIIAAVVEFI